MTMTATYSPDDNKLRLYSLDRLPEEVYRRVHAAGFSWAGAQKLFVAPAWTPQREDLLLELCGDEIGDDDVSLVDRAEERSDRFETYEGKRAEDARRAEAAVSAIADNIPLGQPILVGHHSERRARRDAEKIENGTRRAIKLWQTSSYWERRAAGAIRHAKYKERVDVRARRIKKLEADQRGFRRTLAKAEGYIRHWETVLDDEKALIRKKDGTASTAAERVRYLLSGDWCMDQLDTKLEKGEVTREEVRDRRLALHRATFDGTQRWIEHIDNRLVYEHRLLGDAGGLPADRFEIEIGGQVLLDRGEWARVLRVNRKDGRICSVRTSARYVGVRSIEEIKDYRAPQGDEAAQTAAAMKRPPTCNYPGPGIETITKERWDRAGRDSKALRAVKANGQHDKHMVRTMLMPGFTLAQVFISDAKRVDPPASSEVEAPEVPQAQLPEPPAPRAPRPESEARQRAQLLKEAIKGGVQVVAAPQLFPTPREIADMMVEMADLQPGLCVLEPSAGTGNLVRAVLDTVDTEVLAYEINRPLCSQLERQFPGFKLQVRCRDFLEVTDFQGSYPRVIMNPPFVDGADVAHIKHAITMLAPGGRLVALCADGERQREELKPIATTWEPLPEGSFKSQGTSVRVAMLTIDAPVAA